MKHHTRINELIHDDTHKKYKAASIFQGNVNACAVKRHLSARLDLIIGCLFRPRRSSLRSELVGNEALQGADVSKLVEDLLEDTDMAKFFDEEFEVSSCPVCSYIAHVLSIHNAPFLTCMRCSFMLPPRSSSRQCAVPSYQLRTVQLNFQLDSREDGGRNL